MSSPAPIPSPVLAPGLLVARITESLPRSQSPVSLTRRGARGLCRQIPSAHSEANVCKQMPPEKCSRKQQESQHLWLSPSQNGLSSEIFSCSLYSISYFHSWMLGVLLPPPPPPPPTGALHFSRFQISWVAL